jgi:chromate reductase
LTAGIGAFWPVPTMAGCTPLPRASLMHATPRLLLFPASLRRQSHQRRLIGYIADLIGGACHIDIVEAGEVDLPIFNQDLEGSAAVLDRIIALHQRFDAADGIIVASPEYNGHVSSYLKNTVDWVSRLTRIDPRYAADAPFRGKPLLLASASTGWTGGVLGLQDARTIFSYLGCLVSAEQICVSDAERWVAEGQFRFETVFAEYIERVLGTFLSLVGNLTNADAVHTKEIGSELLACA